MNNQQRPKCEPQILGVDFWLCVFVTCVRAVMKKPLSLSVV